MISGGGGGGSEGEDKGGGGGGMRTCAIIGLTPAAATATATATATDCETAPPSPPPPAPSAAATGCSPEHYFCYMLTSSVCGATYIGASTDPWRRLRQHNGELRGGARATRQKRPWNLHVIVGGFSEWRDALRYEWAWKHRSCRRRVARGIQERTRRSKALLQEWPHLKLEYMSDSALAYHHDNDQQ